MGTQQPLIDPVPGTESPVSPKVRQRVGKPLIPDCNARTSVRVLGLHGEGFFSVNRFKWEIVYLKVRIGTKRSRIGEGPEIE